MREATKIDTLYGSCEFVGFVIADLRFAIEKPLKINLITEQGPKNVFLNSIALFKILI